jgi:TrmH family RNA methyltransferase
MVAEVRDPWAGWTVADGLAACRPAAGSPVGLVAVFEQVRDPGNAGTVIRAADAAGADLVIFADQSADPTAPKVIRASAGSYFHVPVVRAGPVAGLLAQLRASGLRVVAADASGSVVLGSARLSQPTAWLFGNEARGLTAGARTGSDAVVRIPIYGQAESLNLAMAATLCLYASASQRRLSPSRERSR